MPQNIDAAETCIQTLARPHGIQHRTSSLRNRIMRISLAALVLLLPLSGTALADCKYKQEKDIVLSEGSLQRLNLNTSAGDLYVHGSSSEQQIKVHTKACASNEDMLAQVELKQQKLADGYELTTDLPQNSGMGWGNHYVYMDVQIEVPAGISVNADDSSGDIDIEGVTAVNINDSSGDIRVRKVSGAVELQDSSGDIEVSDVGTLHVRQDSSGDIDVRGVSGDAIIDSDNSGDIELISIGGNARVGDDSSGEIRFDDIGGSAQVDNDSSGDISARHVKKDFVVSSDTSGDIDYSDIGGQVDVPSRKHGWLK